MIGMVLQYRFGLCRRNRTVWQEGTKYSDQQLTALGRSANQSDPGHSAEPVSAKREN